MALIGGAIRPLYDVGGLARFKAKFDPRWDARYVAILRRRDLVGLCVALLRLHLRPARPLSSTGSVGGIGGDPGRYEPPRTRRRGRSLRSRPAGQR